MRTCECGCGREVFRRFVHGHNRRLPEAYAIEDRGYMTPCWVWLRGRNGNGYPAIRISKRTLPAHRVYYERKYGPIRTPHLDHLCRVEECVNPDHCEPVTVAENTRRGNSAKLTITQVEEIRSLIDQGWIQSEIARCFGVSPQLICDIKKGRKWVAV